MYRRFKENHDKEYETRIRQQVEESKLEAEREGVVVPKTLEDYVAPSRVGATNDKKTYWTMSSYEYGYGDEDDLGIAVRSFEEKFLSSSSFDVCL